MTIAAAINHFLYSLQKEKQVSKYTSRNYRHYLNRFLIFCRQHSPPLLSIIDVDKSHLDKYRQFLDNLESIDNLPLKRLTKGYHLICLRRFVKFLKTNNLSRLNYKDIKLPSQRLDEPQHLSSELINRLSASPNPSSAIGVRDAAIVDLLANYGLTVSQLTFLNRDDIDLPNQQMIIENNTVRKRTIKLTLTSVGKLKRYLEKRQDNFPPVFIRFRGKKVDPFHAARELRLSDRSIQRLVAKYARKALLGKTVTPMTLRHSFAIDSLRRGVNPTSLQHFLGHKTPMAVKTYQSLVQLSK